MSDHAVHELCGLLEQLGGGLCWVLLFFLFVCSLAGWPWKR